jgi:hypothetical protein
MNCAECKELLVGYIEGLLEDLQKQAVESHLEACPPCRTELAQITSLHDRLTANGKTLAQRNLENKVLGRILREQSVKLRKANKVDRQFQLWRIIMKSQITRFAAAAAIIIVAGLLITFLGTSEPAYALAQTIEASHSVRYLHMVNYLESQDEPMEFWVEFDLGGQLKNMRFHKPAWMEPDDGATVMVWKDNKMQLWIKKKNFLVTLKDEEVAAQALEQAEQLDPKFAVEHLQRERELGNAEVDIEVPADKAEPIVVTATSLKDNDLSFQRMILFVDQATKLVNSVELYKLKDGEYHKEVTLEYYDYNQPIDAKMFSLNEEVSPDATEIVQTAQEVGVVQGDLSDEQVAVELVRQFLQALIDTDYAKAGRLFSGVPAERIEQTYGDTRFIRIISIGEPVPHSLTGGLYVPCTVEIEENGQIRQWHPEHSYVRRVHGQPERWEIIGGFRGV